MSKSKARPLSTVMNGDRVFNALVSIALVVILIVVAYPMIYILSASFSNPRAVVSGKVLLWPVDFTLVAYKEILSHSMVRIGYGNSIFYAVFGSLINLLMTILAAYPLSRRTMPGRRLLTFLFTFTMLFSGGLIPTYILISQLHMIDTRWALLIPNAISIYNMIIARTYFQASIPNELFEASQIDGCNHFMYLRSIVIPLSKSIIAVLLLFYSVTHWNAYFDAFIYLNDKRKYPLQIFLREILILNSTDEYIDPLIESARSGMAELVKYAVIVIASAPFMLMYPFVAKYFVKGVMIGSVKG